MELGVGDAPASEVLHLEPHEQSQQLPLVPADDSVDVVPSDAYGVVEVHRLGAPFDHTPAFELTELSYDDAFGGEEARPIGAETAAVLDGSAIEQTLAFAPVDSMEPICQESVGLRAEAEAAPAPVKRKRGRPPKAHGAGRKATAPKKDEEEVCFICFDGGNLVVCDRRGCPKVYHPACIHRDESFFRSRSRWNCGWHICSICQKAVTYMCYTCTYSVCKACIGGANFFCVRGQKGFCETCYKTIMLIETNEKANEEKEECRRLQQSIKCGLIRRLTVGYLLTKAKAIQEVRVKFWLASEKLRLSHLRDRASDLGQRKEYPVRSNVFGVLSILLSF